MKLTATVNSGTLAGRTFDLESGFLTVGRGDTCSIRFDPQTERIASKQHAFIEAKVDGYYITDNQSTNGTLLNGEKIQTSKLKTGDNIQFGKNGVLVSIQIADGSAAASSPAFQSKEAFRDFQVEQFNQIAESQPVNLQNSIAHIGLGTLDAKPEPSKTKRNIAIGLTIFSLVFLSLVVVGIMWLSVGIVPAVVAAVIAFTPAMIYVLPFIWLDRYDPEPLWLLALAFAWGALVAVVVSFFVNTAISYAVYMGTASAELATVAGAVISAPIFEEGSKGIGLVVLLIFFRRYFDDILDGIVFAGMIALGFATVENVLYYGGAISDENIQSFFLSLQLLVPLFVLRGVLSPFAHVTFTSMTGIGCGISRESHNMFVRIALPVVGYCGAVALHAFWNGMAVIGGLGGFLLGYLFLEIPFFVIFVIFSFLIMYRQNKILKDMLAIDVARGLIPEDHAKRATSAFRSSGWLISGLFNGKFRPRSRYVRAIGKLGLSYWHIQRATAAKGQTASFQQNPILREEVLKWREKV